MRRSLEVLGTVLLFGTATLASGSTPAQFADRFNVLQSYSGGGTMYHSAPAFSSRAADPSNGLHERTMQSLSNEGPDWQPAMAASPVTPTFAETYPHGLPFAYYQTAASGAYKLKLASHGAPLHAAAWKGMPAWSHFSAPRTKAS